MRRGLAWLSLAVLALFCVSMRLVWSDTFSDASPEQLARWLKQYPEADTNHDGKLSPAEARAYYEKLKSGQTTPLYPHEYTFATVSDGVKIALAVGYPEGFQKEAADRKWPTVFSTCGYPVACYPMDPARFEQKCVTVQASVRGSGASGGATVPFTPRAWQDGYEIIENWIAKQPWSNGKVGIVGGSWPGLMGFLTATTNPPSLKAVAVSLLADDFYRGIGRIGGIYNSGFPVNWLNSFNRPDGVFGSGPAAMKARGLDEAAYLEIVKSRPPRDLAEDVLWLAMSEEFDGPKWQAASLCTHASKIRAPIHIMQAYQDEQTGPRGWWLWKLIPDDVPKRLVLTNGVHGTPGRFGADATAWLLYWLTGEGDAKIADPAERVQCYFETPWDKPQDSKTVQVPLTGPDFPLPDTEWTRYYLRAGNILSPEPPAGDERQDVYAVTHDEPTTSKDYADYVLDFKTPTAICGPMVLTLWAQISTLDTDFFALIADVRPDGKLDSLQRGMLRASHRALDESKSDYVTWKGEKLLIRPRHPHTKAEPVTPYQPQEYVIEIFAIGHVFRQGHKLMLRLSRPPDVDPVNRIKSGEPSYRYVSDRPPGTVAILHDREHPSNLLAPLLPKLPLISPKPPAPGALAGIHSMK